MSESYEGEYPTGVYWAIGETRTLTDEDAAELPDGLVAVGDNPEAAEIESEGLVELSSEQATVLSEAADSLDAQADALEATAADQAAELRAKADELRALAATAPSDAPESSGEIPAEELPS